jgi:hypothetical protein
MFYEVTQDCKELNALKGHMIGMSEASAKEMDIQILIGLKILRLLSPEEANKIYELQHPRGA